jgi:hypothetical protein
MEHRLVNPISGNEYVGHIPPVGHIGGAGIFRCEKNGVVSGAGIFRCEKNGAVYSGEYQGNHQHGVGVTKLTHGLAKHVYRGEYKRGSYEGHGVYTFLDGETYRGQFKGDQPEGQGVYTYANHVRTFCWYVSGKKERSVPFDAANPNHIAVLRKANEAEARHIGASLRPTRSPHFVCDAGTGERRPTGGRGSYLGNHALGC